MADDIAVFVPDAPIGAETEAEQQAKQEASLSAEELAQLDRERREAQKKQADAEAMRQNLTLEGLAERLGDLTFRVEALEAAAASSSKSSSASPKAAGSSENGGVPKSN